MSWGARTEGPSDQGDEVPLTAGGREDKGGFTGTVGSNTKQTSAQSS